jgi:hypothetical protein
LPVGREGEFIVRATDLLGPFVPTAKLFRFAARDKGPSLNELRPQWGSSLRKLALKPTGQGVAILREAHGRISDTRISSGITRTPGLEHGASSTDISTIRRAAPEFTSATSPTSIIRSITLMARTAGWNLTGGCSTSTRPVRPFAPGEDHSGVSAGLPSYREFAALVVELRPRLPL